MKGGGGGANFKDSHKGVTFLIIVVFLLRVLEVRVDKKPAVWESVQEFSLQESSHQESRH